MLALDVAVRLTTMSKVNRAIEALLDCGWSIQRDRKHLVLSAPDGQGRVTIMRTAPDRGHRTENILAELRRQRRKYA